MNTGDIRIRDAVLEDAPQIARIWLEGLGNSSGLCGPPDQEAITSFATRIRQPQGKSETWVAVSDGTVVGWQSLQDFGVTQILRIAHSSTYICREWHSKRVGGRLLQHAQTRAGERGFETIVGWIKTDNLSSIRLVQSLGWKFVGILPRTNESQPEVAYYAYAVPDRLEVSPKDNECS